MTITSPAGSAAVDGSSKYRVVSADAHILEPPHIWERWLPAELQDRAPKLAKDAAGGDGWLFAGATEPDPIGLTATPGMPWDQFRWTGVTYEEARAGCYDGAARLADMDADGVDAEILFPPQRTVGPLPGRRGRRLRPGRDRRLQRVPVGGVLRARPHPAGGCRATALHRHRRCHRLPAAGGRPRLQDGGDVQLAVGRGAARRRRRAVLGRGGRGRRCRCASTST